MLARRQLRLAALAALNTLTGVTVDCPGDWETAPGRLPNVKLRVTSDRKASTAKYAAGFTTTVTLEVQVITQGSSAAGAQDALESLCDQVESVLLGNLALNDVVDQIASVNTQQEITADGQRHVAEARISFNAETFEQFPPVDLGPPLTSMSLHIDMIRPFDLGGTTGYRPITVADTVDSRLLSAYTVGAGTYTGSLFPGSVLPAPRISGPDGRDEGTLLITLPTS